MQENYGTQRVTVFERMFSDNFIIADHVQTGNNESRGKND